MTDNTLHAKAQRILHNYFERLGLSQRPPARADMQRELAERLQVTPASADRLLSELESSVGSLWDLRKLETVDPGLGAEASLGTALDESSKFKSWTIDDVAASESPAIALLNCALARRATDIHLDPDHAGWNVRFRIDGRLSDFGCLDAKIARALLSQYKLLAGLDIAEPFRAKEGRLQLPSALAGYEVRVTTSRVAGGEAAALRLLDSRRLRRRLDCLGWGTAALSLVERMLRHGEGLILVTGPTNSGKTTTVYSMLHALDNGQRNIVTIEDPVEFRIPDYRQMEVDPRHGITMTTGLRTLLRMDPDVVLVGEIRDAETAEIAMRAASSGKRVFSTLHTRDVASTVTALRDLHIDNRSLAGNLAGLVSQRLVRRICPACCRVEPPLDDEREFFAQARHALPGGVPHAVGCDHCGGQGYFERVGVFEVVADSPAVNAAIAAGASEGELRELLRKAGVPTLVDDAIDKVQAGLTSVAEVRAMTWIPLLSRGSNHSAPAAGLVSPEHAYRVVVFAAPDDPLELRDRLVDKLGMHPTDAMMQVEHAPGILPERLTEENARACVEVLRGAGLQAEAMPQREIPELEHSEVVHHARCLEGGVEIIELHGASETLVPWGNIELISVGQVPQEDDRHFIVDELITAARRTIPADHLTTRLSGPELWLVRRDPLRAFRIDHKRMNYEYLGPRKTDSATHNFRLLLEELVQRCPASYLTPATRAFLEHGPMRHYEFDSSEALRKATVFHLLLRRRAEPQAANRPTGDAS